MKAELQTLASEWIKMKAGEAASRSPALPLLLHDIKQLIFYAIVMGFSISLSLAATAAAGYMLLTAYGVTTFNALAIIAIGGLSLCWLGHIAVKRRIKALKRHLRPLPSHPKTHMQREQQGIAELTESAIHAFLSGFNDPYKSASPATYASPVASGADNFAADPAPTHEMTSASQHAYTNSYKTGSRKTNGSRHNYLHL